ncbi:MAG: hypothetical protein ABIJ57_13225 [Pseudomonadota bacterium]
MAYLDRHPGMIKIMDMAFSVDKRLSKLIWDNPQEASLIRSVGREWAVSLKEALEEEDE